MFSDVLGCFAGTEVLDLWPEEFRQRMERAREGLDVNLNMYSGDKVFHCVLSGKRIEFVLSLHSTGYQCVFLLEFVGEFMTNWHGALADFSFDGHVFRGRRSGWHHFVVTVGDFDAALDLLGCFFGAVRSAPPTWLYADCLAWATAECVGMGKFKVVESEAGRVLIIHGTVDVPCNEVVLAAYVYFKDNGTIRNIRVGHNKVTMAAGHPEYSDSVKEYDDVPSVEQFKDILNTLFGDYRDFLSLASQPVTCGDV